MAEKKANGAAGATSQGQVGGATPAHAGVKVSKLDAVARALAELGGDATRPQIQSFVKDRFGYATTPDHISNCKSDLAKRAKKAAAKAPQGAKPPAAPTQQKPAASRGGVAAAANSPAKAAIPLDDLSPLRRAWARQWARIVCSSPGRLRDRASHIWIGGGSSAARSLSTW
jgi:hypothetical protein